MNDLSADVIDERQSQFDFAHGTVELNLSLIGTDDDNVGVTTDRLLAALLTGMAPQVAVLSSAVEKAVAAGCESNPMPPAQTLKMLTADGLTAQVELKVTLWADNAALDEAALHSLTRDLGSALTRIDCTPA